jgi:hypothetical protein
VAERDLWDKIWKDRHGEVVIMETPNRWIVAWVILVSMSLLSSSKTLQEVFWWLSIVALVIWSYFEVTQGVNYFRRSLGVVGLVMVIAASFALDMF